MTGILAGSIDGGDVPKLDEPKHAAPATEVADHEAPATEVVAHAAPATEVVEHAAESCGKSSSSSLTCLSKFFIFLSSFAVSVKQAKSGSDIKTENWHENGRCESSEALDHTKLHRISAQIRLWRRHFAKPLILKSHFFYQIEQHIEFFATPPKAGGGSSSSSSSKSSGILHSDAELPKAAGPDLPATILGQPATPLQHSSLTRWNHQHWHKSIKHHHKAIQLG